MCTFPVVAQPLPRPVIAPFVSPTGRGWCLWRDEWRSGPGETDPRRLELVAPVVAGPTALSEGVLTVAPDANLPHNVGLHLFQLGVSPDFNHPRNRRGGHFAFRTQDLNRALQQWWTVSVALLVGTYPDPSRVVLGASISRKPAQTTVKVWVAEGSHAVHQQQREDLAAFLQFPAEQLEYCPHPCIRSILRKKHAAQRGAARGHPHSPCGTTPQQAFHGPVPYYYPRADDWPLRPSIVASAGHPLSLFPTTSPGTLSYSLVDAAEPARPMTHQPLCRFVLPARSPFRKIIKCEDETALNFFEAVDDSST